jgi:hypothetical protein
MANWNAWNDAYKRHMQDAKATRTTYLRQLAEDYDVEYRKVYIVADLLGPEEDFHGLIHHLNNLSVWE